MLYDCAVSYEVVVLASTVMCAYKVATERYPSLSPDRVSKESAFLQ